MSEEEKQAIEQLKSWREYIINHRDSVNKANDIEFYLGTALNLIDKKQNQIKKLNIENQKLFEEAISQQSFANAFMNSNYISKDKVRELANKIHKTLDVNAITRAYQITIDCDFRKLLGEENE